MRRGQVSRGSDAGQANLSIRGRVSRPIEPVKPVKPRQLCEALGLMDAAAEKRRGKRYAESA